MNLSPGRAEPLSGKCIPAGAAIVEKSDPRAPGNIYIDLARGREKSDIVHAGKRDLLSRSKIVAVAYPTRVTMTEFLPRRDFFEISVRAFIFASLKISRFTRRGDDSPRRKTQNSNVILKIE